jgi:hypothetical protein
MGMGYWWAYLAMVAGASVAGLGQTRAARIPPVHAAALSGEMVDLPSGLHGKVGVLVVGFSQGAREGVTEWGKRLAAEYRGSAAVVYYEMPVLAGAPKLLRGMIVRSIKSSVPERAQARFVPLMEGEAAWRALAHYSRPDDPYVLVVDGDGVVRWQTQGVPSDAAYAAVKQQVERLQGDGVARAAKQGP